MRVTLYSTEGRAFPSDRIKGIALDHFADNADGLDASNRPAYNDGRQEPRTLKECCDYLERHTDLRFKR